MPFCQYCGKEVPAGAASCTYCGKPVAGQILTSAAQATGASSSSGLLSLKEIVMVKKILSLREHYDFQDLEKNKVGEGEGNFFQFPAKFVVHDQNQVEV